MTSPRLDLALVSRALSWLYRLRPFQTKRIRCGKVALALLFSLIVAGPVAGAIAGGVSGSESILMAALNAGLIAALIANLLAIVWISVLDSYYLTKLLSFIPPRLPESTFFSAGHFCQFRPPRLPA